MVRPSTPNDQSPASSEHAEPKKATRTTAVPKTRASTTVKESIRSKTPTLPGAVPIAKQKPATHPRSSSVRPIKERQLSSSSISSLVDEKVTARNTRQKAKERKTPEIAITYLGKPRAASDGDLSIERKDKPKFIGRIPKSPPKKAAAQKRNMTDGTSWSLLIPRNTETLVQNSIQDTQKTLRLARIRGVASISSRSVVNDDAITKTLIRVLNKNSVWSISTCWDLLPTIIENITNTDKSWQSLALNALDVISLSMLDRLERCSEYASGIGVDVAAEERSEKAQECIDLLRDVCAKHDDYYKKLENDAIEKLDGILERLKTL